MSASDSLVDCLLTMGAALQVVNSSTAAAKSITICRVEEVISKSDEVYKSAIEEVVLVFWSD